MKSRIASGMAPARQSYAIVVDDHPLVARGIAGYLTTHCDYAVAHYAANAQECFQRIDDDGPPSLLVVDFWLPGGTALALLREAAAKLPSCRLLVMSGDEDARVQIKAMEAGAHGFLRKSEPPETFAQAVATLRKGGTWFPAMPPAELTPALRRELPLSPRDLGLTDRQGQVLALMLRGLPNKQIAKELAISEQTTKEHVTAILGKLGVSNRVEAITLLHGRRLEP